MKAEQAERKANIKEEIELMKTRATQDYMMLATDLIA
jgi:hypothetical protein